MRQKDFVRDNLREGLKAKGRLRRDSVRRRAAVERGKRPARNDLLPGLKIEAVPIDSLRSYSRRLRKSDAAHAEEIANSIGALGFSIPLLIGKENVVIEGEARLEAARLLGLRSSITRPIRMSASSKASITKSASSSAEPTACATKNISS